MRIIGGSARGRPLTAPCGLDTRPTLDRVRESLFSILQTRIPDARVLDAFAGSGALGLEALSRGAQAAVFVDSGRDAQQAVRKNIDTLGFAGRATLLPMELARAATELARRGESFDLLFLDPPYRMTEVGAYCEMLHAHGLAAEDAIFIVEHDARTPPTAPETLEIYDTRRYGDTAITFIRRRTP